MRECHPLSVRRCSDCLHRAHERPELGCFQHAGRLGERESTLTAAPAPRQSSDQVFSALASPVRREVLRLLRDQGPQPVARLADHFAMTRPSLSEHLKVLRQAGLAAETRVGRQRMYRLEAAPLSQVREWLGPFERFWSDRLADLGTVLDSLDEADGA